MLRGPVWLRSTMAGQIPTLASTTRARGMREYTPRPFIRPWIELSARETPAAAYRDTSYYRKANRNRQSTKRRKHILLATRFQIQQCRQKPPSGLTINLPSAALLSNYPSEYLSLISPIYQTTPANLFRLYLHP